MGLALLQAVAKLLVSTFVVQVDLVVTIPKFKFKAASILCLVLNRKEDSIGETNNEIFASDGAYRLAFCRRIRLANTEVYYRARRCFMKANHNVVVDASIDREHDLVITDVILRLEDPRVDSIGLREDLRGEFDRAAGRASWTSEVF